MKKTLLLAAMLVLGSTMFAKQQTREVQVGTYSTDSYESTAFRFPLFAGGYYGDAEFLYTAEDLAGVLSPGDISKLTFLVYGGQSNTIYSKLWLENTDDTTVGDEDGIQFRSTDEMTLVNEMTTQLGIWGFSGKINPANYDEETIEYHRFSNPNLWVHEFKEPFHYNGSGLRVHLRNDKEYSRDLEDYMFVQDVSKISEDKGQNALYSDNSGYGNPLTKRQFLVVRFTITEEVSTTISDVAVDEAKEVTYYNIYGQKVTADTKGVVISSDGKKFFNR